MANDHTFYLIFLATFPYQMQQEVFEETFKMKGKSELHIKFFLLILAFALGTALVAQNKKLESQNVQTLNSWHI